MIAITLTIGTRVLHANLDDSVAGRDFASLLPLELTLSDYHGIEKVADLPRPLDTSDAPARHAAQPGDITTYAPWGNLALFYKPFPASAGLVRLGAFVDDMTPLLGKGPTKVRIDLAN